MEPPSPDAVIQATVELRYHRTTPPSAARPEMVNVITNETGPGGHRQYTGVWDQATQTLSAVVIVPYGVESTIYVVDPAVSSGTTTTFTTERGSLRETPCPQGVTSSAPCRTLLVTHQQY